MEPTAPATPRRVKASVIAWNQNITAPHVARSRSVKLGDLPFKLIHHHPLQPKNLIRGCYWAVNRSNRLVVTYHVIRSLADLGPAARFFSWRGETVTSAKSRWGTDCPHDIANENEGRGGD